MIALKAYSSSLKKIRIKIRITLTNYKFINLFNSYIQILQMGNIKVVSVKFFEEMDLFKAAPTFRVFNQDNYRSCRLGLLSTLLVFFFSYIFIFECIKLMSFETIKCTSVSTRMHSAQTSGKIPMISVSLDFLPVQEFIQMFQFQLQIYKEGKLFKVISMAVCQPEQWKLLGEDYQKQFKQYELGAMFCPSAEYPFNISQTFRSDTLDYVTITMRACNPTNNVHCNPNLIFNYLTARTIFGGSAQVWVYVLDQVLNPENKNPLSYFINIDGKAQLTQKFGGAIAIQYSTFKIQSDTSMLPYERIEKVVGNLIDEVRSYPIQYNNAKTDRLIVISLSMNQKYEMVNCKYGKFDEVLSYAGGLFSLIIAVLAFFFTNFNKYRYEIYAGNLMYPKQKELKMGPWLYIKYSIFDWINLLFKKEKEDWGKFWDNCKDIEERRQVGINQLHVDNLLYRMINSQKMGKYLNAMKIIADSQNIDKRELFLYYDRFTEHISILRNQSEGLSSQNEMSQQILNKNEEISQLQTKIINGLLGLPKQEKQIIEKCMPEKMLRRVLHLVALNQKLKEEIQSEINLGILLQQRNIHDPKGQDMEKQKQNRKIQQK